MTFTNLILKGETYTKSDIIDIANGDIVNFINELSWIKEEKNPFEIADSIARAFKEAYGLIIFDNRYYRDQNIPATVMDLLDITKDDFYNHDLIVAWILLRSFKKFGFKYAEECNIRDVHITYSYGACDLSAQYEQSEIDKEQRDSESFDNSIYVKKWIIEGSGREAYYV